MDFLVRLAQTHESFRKPELEALAIQENIRLEILDYRPDSPFCLVRLHRSKECTRPLPDIARSFVSRSILARGIYELWGQGTTYDMLHEDVRARTSGLWQQYKHNSFRFHIDTFLGKRSSTEQREIVNSFRYLAFEGKIIMKNPEVEFEVFEEWENTPSSNGIPKSEDIEENGIVRKRQLERIFFGRYLGHSRRNLMEKHDLKKRPYISTTSMDAELALVTASLALAAPGKLFLDPFVGTGGFMVAASELGSMTFGCDIDGRAFRGKGTGLTKGVGANFNKYGLQGLFGDCFTSDITNTPLRSQGSQIVKSRRWVDGIIADPPYGVREGMRVLGSRDTRLKKWLNDTEGSSESGVSTPIHVLAQQPRYLDGVLAHTQPGYIAPKKPYSFVQMMDDILDFAARTLVDGGRLAFWMPSANEAEQELAIPMHPLLDLRHTCVQIFNKWSRRLLVYERVQGDIVEGNMPVFDASKVKTLNLGSSADELNPFRKSYFKGFRTE